MDYLIYLSEPKVEMLYSQLPPGIAQQVGAEVGASLGVMSAKLKTNAPQLTPSSKAKAIEAYIGRNYGFGTIAEPKEWVRDQVNVRHVSTHFAPGMFALVGKLSYTYFLLGGSARNVTGNSAPTPVRSALSYLPYMMEALEEGFAKWERSGSAPDLWVDERRKWARGNLAAGAARDELAFVVRDLYEMSRANYQRVQFVAWHLATEDLTGIRGRASIFTPLYVKHVPANPAAQPGGSTAG